MSDSVPRVATPPDTAAAFETPFDRVIAGARALVGHSMGADALAALGAQHVRTGLTFAATSLVGCVGGGILVAPGWQVAGLLAGFVITGAGVLASSRVARGVLLLQATTFAVNGVSMLASLLLSLRNSGPFDVSHMLFGLSMLAFGAGTALATLTPAARAWHRAQLAARALRRKTSLSAWRAKTLEPGDATR